MAHSDIVAFGPQGMSVGESVVGNEVEAGGCPVTDMVYSQILRGTCCAGSDCYELHWALR